MPIYSWLPEGQPKGVVMALHGLVMHGKSFDMLGKSLAEQGYIVYASDMRGYGRLKKEYPHEFCTEKDCKQKISYDKSAKDLIDLAGRIHKMHNDLPMYLVGESLGADMAIRIASANPELADGLILSAPAIKAYSFVDKRFPLVSAQIMWNPRKQLDIRPYVQKYATQDPEVRDELAYDPEVRKHLSIYELLQSRRAVLKSISYVSGITPDKPVLVVMATDDKCVKADGVPLLTSKLRSKDQHVHWFHHRGHILLETSHMKGDTMDLVVSWLNDHAAASPSRGTLRAELPSMSKNILATSEETKESESD